MNRQIKFRGYEPELKQMRYFDLDGYDRNEHDCYGNIMQFTGLKDKNGKDKNVKDIYEGDIIKSESWFNKKEILSNVLIGERGYLMVQEIDSVYNEREYLYELVKSFNAEIIGNIHENHELLNS